MELLQQRISLSVVDLYAMSAVLSRLQSQIVAAGGNGDVPESLQRDLTIGKSFCHRAAGNVSRRLKSLFRNNDRETLAVADAVLGMKHPVTE